MNETKPAETIDQSLLVSIKDARVLLGGIHPNTMSEWIKRGLIKKIPGTYFIARAEIARFIEEMSKPKTPEQRRRGRYKK